MPSAFIAFCNKNRKQMRKDFPDATFGEMGKKFGLMWNALSTSEKDKYGMKATKCKSRRRSRASRKTSR